MALARTREINDFAVLPFGLKHEKDYVFPSVGGALNSACEHATVFADIL